MMTSCNVTPLKKYAGISYRVKYVAVENERVFGHMYVSQQTRDLVEEPNLNMQILAGVYRKRRRNLIQQTLQGPDFMLLNSEQPSEKAAHRQGHCRSIRDAPNVITFNYENAGKHDVAVRRPKVYPPPMRYTPPQKEIGITSLVDQLLLDIYGIPMGDRPCSENDSTASSLRPRPQHQYLQEARLLLKRKDELQILLETLHKHIVHTGGLLVRQLRRKEYVVAKRDKQCDVITAYLQAHSAKRCE
ncbi:TBC1 domain family member 30 [Harpegnathos saltator]|uniref:TBC1 domain family member 30 n=1 Tax=Harpegnathos saltator TaxID=610380 RepID=E2BP02_HARSA|nr:TBC1 domain family member 30 [Harpegnathos saltator]